MICKQSPVASPAALHQCMLPAPRVKLILLMSLISGDNWCCLSCIWWHLFCWPYHLSNNKTDGSFIQWAQLCHLYWVWAGWCPIRTVSFSDLLPGKLWTPGRLLPGYTSSTTAAANLRLSISRGSETVYCVPYKVLNEVSGGLTALTLTSISCWNAFLFPRCSRCSRVTCQI